MEHVHASPVSKLRKHTGKRRTRNAFVRVTPLRCPPCRQDRDDFTDFSTLWHSFASMFAYMLQMFDYSVLYK